MGQSSTGAVNPAPRSMVRDLTWVSAFVIIVIWWIVIGGRHLFATIPKPAIDYLGFSCGYDQLHGNQFLYYPLKSTEHSLAKGLQALELEKPVCVMRCPTAADFNNGFAVDDVSPGLSGVYGDVMSKSRVYPTEQFSDFLCLPQDRSVGTYLTHALKLSNSKLRAWIFASSISSGGAYWLLVAVSCLSLLAGAGVNYVYLRDCKVLHLAAFGVVPTLTVLLIVCSNKVNLFQDYSRIIMASGVTMSSIMSVFIVAVASLVATMLVTYRARTSIGENVFKVYLSAAKSIPGLWVMPSCCAFLMIFVLLLSLRISSSVLLTTPGVGLIPFQRHLLETPHVESTYMQATHVDRNTKERLTYHGSQATFRRRLAEQPDSGDVATQLGKEIGKVVRDNEIQKPVTLPFKFTPSRDLFVHGPDDALLSPQNKLPPNHPGYRHPGYRHPDFRYQPLDGQNLDYQHLGVGDTDLHVVEGGPHRVGQKGVDDQLSIEDKSSMASGGVVLKTSWINVINLFAYLLWCILILEAIISVSNTFVAAWTTVWYYSPPDIGGERGVEMSAIRYASLTTLSSHLSNVIAISAINALLRPLTTVITLAMYIPAVHRWWVNSGSQENRIISPLYNLASCATTLTTAHSLIHGHQ
ncbi:putative transmembrane protein [Gregarina niphandrodes]|uniref:Transmembrane protein n=1 Tax=Gregarina niphandrodes TaxID=110365 RepID=A0A023BAF3_GRENI|nr:putative transmembrane protein [Gregarina niphandrodes]EZG78194.1 putative transmembrane protein [Gregarina niphandrodes]|eukprot:XP_011129414.1 putative transmembrane protein [Gregarina niphandrodes]